MPEVSVILDDSDHLCCGPRRQVGDVVTMDIRNYQGQVYEERHPEAVSIQTQVITGKIQRIQWREAIMRSELRPEGFVAKTLEGYLPGFAIESTDYEDPTATDWAFEFAIETADPIPEPRSDE